MSRRIARTLYLALGSLTLLGAFGTARVFMLNADSVICRGGCYGPSDCDIGCTCNLINQCINAN